MSTLIAIIGIIVLACLVVPAFRRASRLQREAENMVSNPKNIAERLKNEWHKS